jgi:hypothetical protein
MIVSRPVSAHRAYCKKMILIATLLYLTMLGESRTYESQKSYIRCIVRKIVYCKVFKITFLTDKLLIYKGKLVL